MDYYNKLQQAQADGKYHVLVCIPTGGGKTRLAVVYLINSVLCGKNRRVLWIAHSQYLLNQAYSTFEYFLGREWMEENAVLIHSGKYDRAPVQSVRDISPAHRIVICSIQSLFGIQSSMERLFGADTDIVIDEAHHAVAPNYLETLYEYARDKNVIGLSATPIRMDRQESERLYRFFHTDLGVRVDMFRLLREGYLVRPIFQNVVYRNGAGERPIEDIADLHRYLAEYSADYTEQIVTQYRDNQQLYGKTVVFAVNKDHARELYARFSQDESITRNHEIFLVYSGMNRQQPPGMDREEQFRGFSRSKNGVLINVNVMNEGVDIPDIQTVFMTKPLNSKIAVTQIVGRALRNAPGKKNAYVVNFAVGRLGRKLMLAMPRFAYQYYVSQWEEQERRDLFKQNEKSVSALCELAGEVIEKEKVSSFSRIVLAGNYIIVSAINSDFVLPVSLYEYRKIEEYRSGRSRAFPRRLFFHPDSDCEPIRALFDQARENRGDVLVTFEPYDSELIDQIDALMKRFQSDVAELLHRKASREQIEEYIETLYDALFADSSSEIVWYLSEVGVDEKHKFKQFMVQELVSVKRQIRQEKKRSVTLNE